MKVDWVNVYGHEVDRNKNSRNCYCVIVCALEDWFIKVTRCKLSGKPGRY